MVNHDAILKERGILEAAQQAGWKPYNAKGRDGWQYPIQNNGTRWRAADSKKPKYKWIWSKPAGTRSGYCPLPDRAKEAVEATNGDGWLVNGETSVLSFHAANMYNVFSPAYGEGIIRADELVEQCQQLGITRLFYAPDNDNTGIKSADVVRNAIKDTAIELRILDWQRDKEGYDANDLWCEVQFNREDFQRELCSLNTLILPAASDSKALSKHRQNIVNSADYDDAKQQIAVLLGYSLNDFKADGWARRNISSPFREDRNPSANYNIQSGALNDFGDRAYNLKELCEHFNIDLPKSKRGRGKSDNVDLSASPEERETPDAVAINTLTKADIRNVKYVSDLIENIAACRTLALKSALGTGKTEAMKRYSAQYNIKRVLYIAHSESLCKNVAERLDFENYQDIPHDMPIGSIDKLVVSINSLYRLEGTQPYDLVIWDEAEQGMPHIWGGTMRGGDDQRAYAQLETITKQAGQVVALDAHMTDKVANWLRDIRGDLVKIDNQYRPSRGDIRFMKTQGATLEQAIQCADENPDGCTVLLCSSQKTTRTHYHYYTQRYGADSVFTVHGRNSSESVVREVLKNINEAVSRYRVIIASPSIATGIDVQAVVAGVFGFYDRQPLIATQIMQQMMRFRNARQRALYVPNIEGNLPEDELDILLRERGKSARTSQLAGINRGEIATPTQAKMAKLWATYEAATNKQCNNLFGYVYHLAAQEGFTPVLDTSEGKTGKKLLSAMCKELEAADDERRINTPAISREDLNQKRINRTISEADTFGYERWKIEDTVGLTITPELNDRYKKRRARLGLIRFTNFMQRTEYVQELDREEVRYLPHERRNHTATRNLFEETVDVVFGEAGLTSTEVINRGELEARIKDFIHANMDDIRLFIDGRSDLSENLIPILRRILASHGIKLCSRQERIDGKRVMVYWLDLTDLQALKVHAHARIAHLKAKEAAKSTYIETTSYVNLGGKSKLDYFEQREKDFDTLLRVFSGGKHATESILMT